MATRSQLQQVLDRLAEEGWQILRTPPSAPDPDLLYLVLPDDTWTAFDAGGELVRRVEFEWGGGLAPDLQVAFARAGLTALATPWGPTDTDEAEPGVVILDPQQASRLSDLRRLTVALADLDRQGYVAEADLAYTTTGGWEEVLERTDARHREGAVFWNTQSHEKAFDEHGDLQGDLQLHWRGDKDLIARAIRSSGLHVTVPDTSADTITVSPGGPR